MDLLMSSQILANIATMVGVPIAIVIFVFEKRKERREREYGTYNALDEKYIEFLKLCIEHPEFDLYYYPVKEEIRLSPKQKIQQYAAFEILVSLLERAFLMYRDQSNDVKTTQWNGWNEYMQGYAQRATFRELWLFLGDQYDIDFIGHMNSYINGANQTAI